MPQRKYGNIIINSSMEYEDMQTELRHLYSCQEILVWGGSFFKYQVTERKKQDSPILPLLQTWLTEILNSAHFRLLGG